MTSDPGRGTGSGDRVGVADVGSGWILSDRLSVVKDRPLWRLAVGTDDPGPPSHRTGPFRAPPPHPPRATRRVVKSGSRRVSLFRCASGANHVWVFM